MGSNKEYWETELRKAGEKWVIGHLIWKDFWESDGPLKEYKYHGSRGVTELGETELLEDPQGRGFILTHHPVEEWDRDIVEIYFAFVIPEHRRQGVLRGMMERLKEKSKRRKFWIECKKDVGAVWRAQGFKPCKSRRIDTSECEEEYILTL